MAIFLSSSYIANMSATETPIEVDPAVNEPINSDYESGLESEITSITSSLKNGGVYENGRRYHRWKEVCASSLGKSMKN
jgi:hypothetical protein